MSTTLYKSSNTIDVKSVRYSVVRILRRELAEFVQKKKDELKMSYEAIAARSRMLLTHGTAWNIANQKTDEIKESSLQGLAYAFDMTFDEIARIAYGEEYSQSNKYKESRFANLSEKFDRLIEKDQRDLEIVLSIIEREIEFRLRKTVLRNGAEMLLPLDLENQKPATSSLISTGTGRPPKRLSPAAKKDIADIEADAAGRVRRKKAGNK